VAQAGREHVGLDPAREQAVGRLLADEALEPALARRPLRLDDLRRRERGGADVADLALVDEVRQRAQRLLDVGVRLGTMDLVEVDPVGLEPPQGVLDLADDPAPRVAELVGVVAHRAVHLGREHDVVAAPGERLADDLLRLAARVDVGGVDEVDPGVEGAVDDLDALVVVRVAPAPEHHRAEAQRGHLDAGAGERAAVHRPEPTRAWRASVISVTTDAARSESSWI
jgi:hypothetical protein